MIFLNKSTFQKTFELVEFSHLKKILLTVSIAVVLKILTLIYDFLVGPFYFFKPSGIENSLLAVVIDLCLFRPILEEYAFRYFLMQNDLRKILVSISFFLAYCTIRILNGIYLNNSLIILDFIELGSAILIYSLLWLLFSKIGNWEFQMKNGINQILISSFIFGLIHINSFDQDISRLMLFIIPLIFLGLVLSIVRIRFGFIYSVLLHCLYNAIAIGALLLII